MTNIQAATKATRSTVRRVLGARTGITVKTAIGYDVARRITTTVTTVSYPLGTAYGELAEALAPGTMAVVAGEYAMTIVRAI